MKQLLVTIILIPIVCIACMGQNNPNAAADSINAAARKANDSIRAATGKMGDSINSASERFRERINEEMEIITPPNPFNVLHDTTNIFDSLHGNLTVMVKNINKIIGNLNVAIFNSYMSFINNGPFFKGAVIPITNYSMTVSFDSIPKGTYSVAIFHDEDKNGVMAKNQINIPLEGYGFSNNAAVNFGPPNYNQTKFLYTGKNKTITIYMSYFKFPK